MESLTHFYNLAKEVNFDLAALYEKDPQMVQILGGGLILLVLVVAVVVVLVIKNKVRKGNAQKALQNLTEQNIESFGEYQENLEKILKILPSAKADIFEALKENKEKYYKEQLQTLQEFPLVEQIDSYEEMAGFYKKLAKAAKKDEELQEFYTQKATELIEEGLYKQIETYMQDFSFTPDDVTTLEKIVAYANEKEEQEQKEKLFLLIENKLQNVDFGSSLEIFTFVRSLDPQKLGEIYTYCKEQQDKLFEDSTKIIAGEVLEYLLDNGEEEKVLSYIKSLEVPTHLQELYYRFFNQKDNTELDFAFIANPLEIQQDYKSYIEHKITDSWRDHEALEKLLQHENIENAIGHDGVRKVIERIDALTKELNEEEVAREALDIAKEAREIALEARNLARLNNEDSEEEEIKAPVVD
jgi:hypothetical protein